MPEIDSDPRQDDQQEPIGWRVLDPDGNVIASGPCVELDAVSDTGEEQ